MSSNTGPASQSFTAFEMQQALDLQKARSRASFAAGVSIASLAVAIGAVAVSVWLVAQNGERAATLAAYPAAMQAAQYPVAQQDPRMALAPVQLPPPAPVAPQQTAPAPAPVAQAPAPVAPTPAAGVADASQIYLAAGTDGEMYAFDAMANTWFRFDESGLPVAVAQDAVPQEAQQEALRQHETGVNALSPNPQAAEQAAQQAQSALESMGDDQRYPLVNQLLAQPEVASQFLQAVERAAAIDVPGEFAGGHPIYVFYDPRCPFSQQAFKALDGQFEMRWLHTLALGGDGADVTAYILGDMDVERNGEDEIVAAVMGEDGERHERLRSVMDGQQPPQGGEMSEAHTFAVDENTAMMRQLYGQQTSMIGVPSFIVPRPDGTALFLRGYDDETVSIINAAVRGEE